MSDEPRGIPKGLKSTHYRRADSGELERLCTRCDSWYPATVQYFRKAKTISGVNGFCITCCRKYKAQWEYTARRKRGEIKGKAPGWTWHNKWVEVSQDAISKMQKRVRSECFKADLMWLFDDVFAEALVRMHQGNWVNAKQCVFSVLDRELGHTGTAEREANKKMIDDFSFEMNQRRIE